MSRIDSEVHKPQSAEGRAMISLMRQGVIEALRNHKSEGRTVITWDPEARQVVEIPPGEIVIPEDIGIETAD